MKRVLIFAALPLIAGCLSTSVQRVAEWDIGCDTSRIKVANKPKYGIVRVVQVVVRAPYSNKSIAVLRQNGSIAFDHYNEFASSPTMLIKSMTHPALEASGLFTGVVGAVSTASDNVSAEIAVTRLALDCRESGERKAVADVLVRLIADGRILATGRGSGVADASDSDFSAAFTAAVTSAYDQAFAGL